MKTKYIQLIVVIFFSLSLNAQSSDLGFVDWHDGSPVEVDVSQIATVCDGSGAVCITYTEVYRDGYWVNACCEDLEVPPPNTCTDDCGEHLPRGAGFGLLSFSGMGIDGMEFEYDLPNGEVEQVKIVLKEDGVYLNDVLFTPFSDVTAVRLKILDLFIELSLWGSDQTREVADLAASITVRDTEVILYPNPMSSGEQLRVKSNFLIKSVGIYNMKGELVDEMLSSDGTYEMIIPSDSWNHDLLLGGLLQVRVDGVRIPHLGTHTIFITD